MTTEYTLDQLIEHFRTLEGDGVYRPALDRFNRWRAVDHREVAVKTLREAAERIRRNLEDSLAASYLDAMADDRLEQTDV